MVERISRDGKANEAYSDKLLKILPPELTATYFALRTFAEASSFDLGAALLIATLVLCGVFFFVADQLINMTLVRNKVLYLCTFLVWVGAIDGLGFVTSIFNTTSQQEAVSLFAFSALAAIWSFGVPFLIQVKE